MIDVKNQSSEASRPEYLHPDDKLPAVNIRTMHIHNQPAQDIRFRNQFARLILDAYNGTLKGGSILLSRLMQRCLCPPKIPLKGQIVLGIEIMRHNDCNFKFCFYCITNRFMPFLLQR